MDTPVVCDCETLSIPEKDILDRLPEWSEDEARTRLPKTYKNPEAISGWLEKDRAGYTQSVLDKAALTPEFATIAVIGLWINGGVEQFCLGEMMGLRHRDLPRMLRWFGTEKEMLSSAWRELNRHDKIAGWNVFFDANMLIRRSWILGVPVPVALFDPLARYPFGDRWLDMMELYKAGRRDEKFTSLDNALNALGLPPKTGSGKDFPLLWETDRKAALAYNQNDLIVEAEIGKRMGVIRTPEPAIPVMTRMDMEEVLP